MNEIVAEWIEKAEEDYTVALRESRARKNPCYNAVCFHSQQCIEKYLKAILQKQSLSFKKTHDLEILLNDCLSLYPMWEFMRVPFKELSRYAVLFRYPGESANKDEAKRAVDLMNLCRNELRKSLF